MTKTSSASLTIFYAISDITKSMYYPLEFYGFESP